MVSVLFNTLLVLVLLVLVTFLPLAKWEHYIIRIWDYPKKQVLVGILLVLLLKIVFSEISSIFSFVAIGSSVLAIIFLLYTMARYSPLVRTELKKIDDSTNKVSLFIGNVEMKNDQFSKLIKEILNKNADIVMLVETDTKWQQALEKVESHYEYCHHLPLDNTYGILIYSKVKLENPQFKYLVDQEIPSFHASFQLASKNVRFYGLHPEPPFPKHSKDTVQRDAEILLIGKEIKKMNEPVIVAGDLNDVCWSYTTKLFQKTSSLLDPRIGRGFFSTFHSRKVWARWPLDHVFCSKHFYIIRMERLNYIGSDHFPIYLELSLDNDTSEANEVPENTESDEKELVNDKVDQA